MSSGVSIQTTILNDADNSVALLFQAPKAGTLNQIGIGVNTFTAPPNYNVAFVTLDGSFLPTATAAGASGIFSWAPASTGWAWVTLTTGLVVARGDLVCARIWPGGTAPTGSSFITIRRHSVLTNIGGLPQALEFATAWTRQTSLPIGGMAARYTDGQVCGGLPSSGASGQPDGPSFNSGSASPEHGAVFSVPVNMTVDGLRYTVDPVTAAGSSAEFRLYDAGSTQLAAFVQPAGTLVGTGNNVVDVQLATSIALTAGSTYRMSMIAAETESRNIPSLLPPDTDSKASMPEGSRWSYTSRPLAGSWTDIPLTVPLLGLWVSLIS
jgi:hypothetical protein